MSSRKSWDVEQDPPRHLVEAVAEHVDHRRHHPLERGLGRQVLQPAHRRLRAQLGAGLGQAADRHLEGRIVTQGVAVVGVRVAGGDHQGAKADHFGQPVAHPFGRTRILDAARQPIGEGELALDLREHQDAGVRRHPPAVERDVHRLAGDG